MLYQYAALQHFMACHNTVLHTTAGQRVFTAQRVGSVELKRDLDNGKNSCYTMADNMGRGMIPTGHRKSRCAIR